LTLARRFSLRPIARRAGPGVDAACVALLFGVFSNGCVLAVDSGSLSEGCPAGEKACGGRCVSAKDPEYGCGGLSCQPCALPNATSLCLQSGECGIAACLGTFDDCDDDDKNGCEIDTDTSALHCGGCGAEPCEVEGAEPTCAHGLCAIRRCLKGRKDCNRKSIDGCEVEITSDPKHCGDCERACDAGCEGGVCRG